MTERIDGIIVKGLGGLYAIRTDDKSIISCKARGSFRHDGIIPYVGDRVTVSKTENGSFIEQIAERKNCLIRPPVANLDVLFTVVAAAKPSPMLNITDKLISIAEYNSIEPVIIITKNDLDESSAESIAEIYKSSGFTVFVTGIDDDKKMLSDFIRKTAAGKISAFAGASGVGKSTVLNAVFPNLRLETGNVSHKTERGKHTTRHVELFRLGDLLDDDTDGYIADTPGFSLIDFTRFDFYKKDDLVYTFREFEEHLGKCKYTKCTHVSEDGCSIVEAVKNGTIPKTRHESYVEIYNTLKNKHDWE